MNFGNWNETIHDDLEQKKRFARAIYGNDGKKEKIPALISINSGNQTAVYADEKNPSNSFDTSLFDCSCTDYIMRGLPCKHIYALAAKLGLISPSDAEKRLAYKNETEFLKGEAKEYLNSIDEQQAEKFIEVFRSKTGYIVYSKTDCPEYFFESGIFEKLNDERPKLQRLKKSELQNLSGGNIPSSLKKDEYITALLEESSDTLTEYLNDYIVVEVSEKYKPMITALKNVLTKRFQSLKVQSNFTAWQ